MGRRLIFSKFHGWLRGSVPRTAALTTRQPRSEGFCKAWEYGVPARCPTDYSVTTAFTRLRGWSTSHPLFTAT